VVPYQRETVSGIGGGGAIGRGEVFLFRVS
jgi:hypothetical protein